MKKIIIIFVLLTTHAWSADYDEDCPDCIKDPCNSEYSGGLAVADLCLQERMKPVDKELNLTYQKAIAYLQKEEEFIRQSLGLFELVKPFRESQRAWLKYRDCLLYTSPSPRDS